MGKQMHKHEYIHVEGDYHHKKCMEANINHKRINREPMLYASILSLISKANLLSKNCFPGSIFSMYLLLVHKG